jgi:hypothetical protein
MPRADSIFEPVRDRYGWRLALVFGNHAPGGICPYYAQERCLHCDIGAGEGAAFDHATNRLRLAWFREHYERQLPVISHAVLYNSGSVLNPREMPADLLDEIVTFAGSLPAVRAISLDSREAYIRSDALRRIQSVVGSGIMIRPILGIESADDRIRNEVLRKATPHTAIARVFRDLGTLADELGPGSIGLDVNVVIAGPGTAHDTAVDDAVMTARSALISGVEHGVKVDLNLHPYYRSSRGAISFPEHRRCSLATTVRVAARVAEMVESMALDSSIFIGWHDEGHDTERDERQYEMDRARAAFDLFNQTNDPGVLLGLESCGTGARQRE